MKINKLFTLFLFFTITISAQEEGEADIPVEVKMTEVFKDKRKFTNMAFSTEDGKEGVVIGRRYKKGYYIEHYDKNINLVKNFDFEVDKRRGAIEKAFISDGKLCLIEYLYNKKSKKLEYYSNISPLDKFSFKRELLLSTPLKDVKRGFGFFGFGNDVDGDVLGDFYISKNQEYIAATLDIKNKDSETHRLFVFNNKLEKVFQTEFKRGIKDRKFRLQNIDVDERDGTVYLLGKSFPREKRKKKEGGKYQYELYKINGSKKQSLIFDSGENFVGSLTTVINDGKLLCVGFYSERNDSRYKGLAYFDVDANEMQLKNSVYSPFTKQFILDKYGKNKDKELRNISIRDIHITENNECILNAEEFFITTHFMSNPNGGGSTYYIYHFRDIISTKMDTNGKLLWARNINKKQAARYYSPYLSYTSTYYDGKSYFFINCSDKVKKLRNDRLQFKGVKTKKSNLYVITLDESGNFEYKKILDDKDSVVPFAVGRGYLNNNGEDIIFQGRKGRKKQVMKLSLK